MINPYLTILIFLVVISGFLITMLILSSVIGPKYKTKTKMLPFECGSVSVGDIRRQRFNVRFYLVALLFILFDVEIIMLYPWASSVKELSWPGFYAVLVFFVPLVIGFLYEWKRGVLDWNA
ncbi:MAG: NADH-quinone oxidoreductase subunit A [Bdellovibrionales bacterium]|nr:NADH-quinone oxidoreductase subunit A [Bdellovibrionales bacterium]